MSANSGSSGGLTDKNLFNQWQRSSLVMSQHQWWTRLELVTPTLCQPTSPVSQACISSAAVVSNQPTTYTLSLYHITPLPHYHYHVTKPFNLFTVKTWFSLFNQVRQPPPSPSQTMSDFSLYSFRMVPPPKFEPKRACFLYTLDQISRGHQPIRIEICVGPVNESLDYDWSALRNLQAIYKYRVSQKKCCVLQTQKLGTSYSETTNLLSVEI